MRKKGLLEVIAIVVTSLSCKATMKVEVGSEVYKALSKFVYVKNLCCCHCFLHLQQIVIMENAMQQLMNEILYVDDLDLMSKRLENLRKKFLKWKEAFESRALQATLKKTKVVVNGLKEEIRNS